MKLGFGIEFGLRPAVGVQQHTACKGTQNGSDLRGTEGGVMAKSIADACKGTQNGSALRGTEGGLWLRALLMHAKAPKMVERKNRIIVTATLPRFLT